MEDLPKELVCEVFHQLPAPIVAKSVLLVSHEWRQLALDDYGTPPSLMYLSLPH